MQLRLNPVTMERAEASARRKTCSRVRASVLIMAIAIGGCDDDDNAAVRTGYFKSDDRTRALAYQVHGTPDRDTAEAIFKKVTWTAGQITAVYVYPEDASAPADALTFAPTFGEAIALFDRDSFDDWTWRLWIGPSGARRVLHQDESGRIFDDPGLKPERESE